MMSVYESGDHVVEVTTGGCMGRGCRWWYSSPRVESMRNSCKFSRDVKLPIVHRSSTTANRRGVAQENSDLNDTVRASCVQFALARVPTRRGAV